MIPSPAWPHQATNQRPAESLPAGQTHPLPEWLARIYVPQDWRADLQLTYVWQEHPSFPARYTGPHSLLPQHESGYTLSFTLFLGYQPWPGLELFYNPEVVQSAQLSGLHGLGGLTNGENQKASGLTPSVYNARAFLRQSISLVGPSRIDPGVNQFGRDITSRRLVITAGWMSMIDIFDTVSLAHDPRTEFLNWALTAHGASDYPANTRGYTLGATVEYYHDDWIVRWGHFAQPRVSNGPDLDYRLATHFGEVLEVEHDHLLYGWTGKVRVMSFINRAAMGGFDDALALGRQTGQVPEVAQVRRDREKLGFGISAEQEITTDLGAFVRFSWNDGRTETFAFAEIDRSLTLGGAMRGKHWYRPYDTAGVAAVWNVISAAHRHYLDAGGLGNFIGDGQLTYSAEQIFEAYYSLHWAPTLWVSGDFQLALNPAYNTDRGPVVFLGIRLHAEY